MPLSAKRLKRSRRRGPKCILAVEMEAAALYAFAHVANARVLCLAHVTNTMGIGGEDFEKGQADGTQDALAILETTVAALYKS